MVVVKKRVACRELREEALPSPDSCGGLGRARDLISETTVLPPEVTTELPSPAFLASASCSEVILVHVHLLLLLSSLSLFTIITKTIQLVSMLTIGIRRTEW